MTAATAPNTTGVDGFLAFLAGVTAGAVRAALHTEDAVLDAVVPNLRFGVAGASAVAHEYGRWFTHPGRIEELRRHATPTGEVVEYTLSWAEGGVPHAVRHVHVLDLAADGRIAADHAWCGGRWPAELLAQMEEARDAH
jgi:hypothetical protein